MFKHIFLVGIGGISMSGIARILQARKIKVSGSDICESVETKKLQKEGIEVYIGHQLKNLAKDVDLVVVSAAIDDNNSEIAEAKKRNIPIWRRLQLVDYLVDEKVLIAVAGMHGKTTISSMIATVCVQAQEDPTILVGGEVKEIAANARYGKGELWVVEACEYKRSFLDLKPNIAVISNIEEEHLDIYRDLEDIMDTFGLFLQQVDNNGLVVACLDNVNVAKLVTKVQANVVGYGWQVRPKYFTGVYWQIKNYHQKGSEYCFEVWIDDEYFDTFGLALPGKFNVSNAVATVAVADFLVIDPEIVKKALRAFTGAKRRFDIYLDRDDITVIDDYGHHPTEITNVLQAVRDKYDNRPVWAVWQSHQYSRTWQFLDDFVDCFQGVAKLIILPIYEARDSQEIKEKIDEQKLEKIMKKAGIDCRSVASYDEAVDFLEKNTESKRVVLTVGAGPVDEVAAKLTDKISKKKTSK